MFVVFSPATFVLRVCCGVHAMRDLRDQVLDERLEVSLLVVTMDRLAIGTNRSSGFRER